jgi:hypothetical protein
MASIEDMIKEAQGPVPRRRQDSMRATPRNAALGSVADLLAAASSPERTQHMQMMADTFQLPSMAKTLDLLSYGEPLTTGAGGLGGTTRVKPEVMDTAMNLAPFAGDVAMATKGLPVGLGIKKVSGKAAKAAAEAAPAPEMSEAQKAVLAKWGSKHEREAALKKRVAEDEAEQAANESAGMSPEKQVKAVRARGSSAAVPPDIYRQMAATKGDEAVMKAARAGKHLRPDGSGGYIGGPRTVTSPQGLGTLRRDIDKDFINSVEAVKLADEDRLGTWYDRAKSGIAQSSDPWSLDKILGQHAAYSAGVSPESELGFALKHLNSRAAGEPGMAYRGAVMRKLDEAEAANQPIDLAFKTDEYRNKNDPRIPNAGLFGVNDFRRAQGMGYTDPQGMPWKAGVSDTMHPFMDAETALQVDRANKAGIGGRTDWNGAHIQELPWVYGKAQDIFTRGEAGRFAGEGTEGIEKALQEANNTARDYFYKHATSATHEAIPGASTGHVPSMLTATPEEKLAYGQTGRWDRPNPYSLEEAPDVGAGNRDVIYSALGMRQLPSETGIGAYKNSQGVMEHNPLTIARPLADFPTGGGGGRIADPTQRMLEYAEQLRGVADAQEAAAFNLPNTKGGVTGKNALVLDTRHLNPNKLSDPSMGVLPTKDQLAGLIDLVEKHGMGDTLGVSATSRGATIFPFDSNLDPKVMNAFLKKAEQEMQSVYPSDIQKSVNSSGYVPGIGKWGERGIEPTTPYTGEATMNLLQKGAELPQDVSTKLGESEDIRKAIKEKMARDAALPEARGDIQETRRFFSEADWPKAVDLIRKGMTPAAALAALGYSASSMAEEPTE